MGKVYINYKYEGHPAETIDECDNMDDAWLLICEYEQSLTGSLWLSPRACKGWHEKEDAESFFQGV